VQHAEIDEISLFTYILCVFRLDLLNQFFQFLLVRTKLLTKTFFQGFCFFFLLLKFLCEVASHLIEFVVHFFAQIFNAVVHVSCQFGILSG